MFTQSSSITTQHLVSSPNSAFGIQRYSLSSNSQTIESSAFKPQNVQSSANEHVLIQPPVFTTSSSVTGNFSHPPRESQSRFTSYKEQENLVDMESTPINCMTSDSFPITNNTITSNYIIAPSTDINPHIFFKRKRSPWERNMDFSEPLVEPNMSSGKTTFTPTKENGMDFGTNSTNIHKSLNKSVNEGRFQDSLTPGTIFGFHPLNQSADSTSNSLLEVSDMADDSQVINSNLELGAGGDFQQRGSTKP
jgi:hypothetical protein